MASPSSHRIISLLPSATEIVCLAGAEASLVGRSHECDYPASITGLPVLTAAANGHFTSSREVHDVTTSAMTEGRGLYTIDEQLLLDLKPTIIVTQSLCSVCSIDLVVVERVVAKSALNPKPTIIDLNPQSMQDVLDDVVRVGDAAGTLQHATTAVQALQLRLQGIRDLAASMGKPKLSKCCFLEWTDPLFCGGHWTPALIELAGGCHPLNLPKPGQQAAGPSFVVEPEAVVEMDPDLIIICPCGLDLSVGRREAAALARNPWWRRLRAVQQGNVFLVDGNAHFNRPGPRLLDATDFLVAVMHERWELIPAGFAWELLALLPDPPTSAAAEAGQAEEEQLSTVNGIGAESTSPVTAVPQEEVGGQEDGPDCDGSHCAPGLPRDVEDAYEAALTVQARSYKDPISGYQCFTEAALRSRSTCCGNRCRHCPYGHFKVNTQRKGVRLNRITAPAVCSWGNSGLPAPTQVSLLAVGCGQHLPAATRLQELRSSGADVMVLVAVDPFSRAMWGSSGAAGTGESHQACGNGDSGMEPLAAVMDWCLKSQVCMVAVPVSVVRAQREAAQLAEYVLREAQAALGTEAEGRPPIKVSGVTGVDGDGVPSMPWLPHAVANRVADASWSSVMKSLQLGQK